MEGKWWIVGIAITSLALWENLEARRTCRVGSGCMVSCPRLARVISPEPMPLGYMYGADWAPSGGFQLDRFRDGWLMPVGTYAGWSSACC